MTNHSLRRTFCFLAYLAGDGPDYVMDQMGHEDARLALNIYRRYMARRHARTYDLDALVPGFQWALIGTKRVSDASTFEHHGESIRRKTLR